MMALVVMLHRTGPPHSVAFLAAFHLASCCCTLPILCSSSGAMCHATRSQRRAHRCGRPSIDRSQPRPPDALSSLEPPATITIQVQSQNI